MDLYEQIRGMADCREGLPPQSKDESYLNGYGIEYQLEQINDNNKGMNYGKPSHKASRHSVNTESA